MANKYIYILAKDGTPLMPTTRKRRIDKLVQLGKARILETVPMVVQLLYDVPKETQSCFIAPDCGRTNIGLAIVDIKGKPLMLMRVLSRNEEIKSLMTHRKAYRRASRMGERKARQRLAKKHHTMFAAGVRMRKLPQCEKLIACHYIKNTEARFCNRKRVAGWLTPTTNQLLQTHINLIEKVRRWIPISDIAIEVNRFAFAKMEDPTIFGKDFQNGPLKGFASVNEYIHKQQEGICLFCGEHEIEEYHHIIRVEEGGSEHYTNKAGLCKKCHDLVQNNKDANEKLKQLKKGTLSKYKGVSVLNQMMPFFIKAMYDMFGEMHVHLTNGKATARTRDALGIVKDNDHPCHVIDAYISACNVLNVEPHNIDSKNYTIDNMYEFFVKQYRRHDRANIHLQTERTYKQGKKTVAKNRNKRENQKCDSLHEFYLKQKKRYGKQKARKIISTLNIKKSRRHYNDHNRLMPGTEIFYEGKRYIVSGQQNSGRYYLAENFDGRIPANKCTIVKHNRGLVFVS